MPDALKWGFAHRLSFFLKAMERTTLKLSFSPLIAKDDLVTGKECAICNDVICLDGYVLLAFCKETLSFLRSQACFCSSCGELVSKKINN